MIAEPLSGVCVESQFNPVYVIILYVVPWLILLLLYYKDEIKKWLLSCCYR